MTPTAATLALGPSWLDPQQLLDGVGAWAIVVVALILFAECGLLVGFFLPGDSLLFTVGLLVAGGVLQISLPVLVLLAIVGAVAGNLVGYWIGRKAGPAIFNRANSRLFRQEYVERTHEFFERYGARAIVLARFVPIVRTFITVMAGVGRMSFRRFAVYSSIGGVLWVIAVTVLGYFLGQVTFIKDNLEIIFVVIVLLSIIPLITELVRSRRRGPEPRRVGVDTRADAPAPADTDDAA